MALKGNQKRIDKNNNNRIDAEDFKILKAEKAKGRGMGLQDEKVKPGKVMKARMGKATDYQRYLKGLKEATKKGPKGSSITAASLDKQLMKTKNPYSDLKKTTEKGPRRYKTMEEMRRAKGFKPGESSADFNKRMALKKRAIEAGKATRIGKIALGVAAVGLGAKKFLESKMKKKEKKNKKMLGGMMKPQGYDIGGGVEKAKEHKKVIKDKIGTVMGYAKEMLGPIAKATTPVGVGQEAVKKIIEARKKKNLTKSSDIPENKFKRKLPKDFPKFKPTRPAGARPMPIRPNKTFKRELLKPEARIKPGARRMGGGLMEATARLKAQGKMGGGMMQRPMAYKLGGFKPASPSTVDRTKAEKKPREADPKKLMGGGMMKPMGYKSGKSIKVKCKLGRNKPTKMY